MKKRLWTLNHLHGILKRLDTRCGGCRFGEPEKWAGGAPCGGCCTRLAVGVIRDYKNGMEVIPKTDWTMKEFIISGMRYNTLTNLQVIDIFREYELIK